jgi:hypothetical protein
MSRYPESYAEAIAAANRCRDAFGRRRDDIRAEVVSAWVRGKRDYHGTPIRVIVDRFALNDPWCKAYVADNRWFLEYARTFAVREAVLDRVARELHVDAQTSEIIDLLRKALVEYAGPTPNTRLVPRPRRSVRRDGSGHLLP